MAIAQPAQVQAPENQEVETREEPQIQEETVATETQAGGEQAAATPPAPPAIDLTDPKQKAAYEKAYGEGLAHRSQEIQALREQAEQYKRMEALAASDRNLYDAIQNAVQRRMAGLPPAAAYAPQSSAPANVKPEAELTAKELIKAAQTEFDVEKSTALIERATAMIAEEAVAKVRRQFEPEVQERQAEKVATEWQREEARLTNFGLNLKDPAVMDAANQKIEAARQALYQRNAAKLRAAGLDPSAASRMPLSPREIVNEAFADEFPQLGIKQAQAKAANGQRKRVATLAQAQTEGEGASMGIATTPVNTGQIPYGDLKERAWAMAGE